MYIHKKLLQICDNKIDLYEEFIENIKKDYNDCIKNLIECKKSKNMTTLRPNIHKILGIISYLDKTSEIIYLCKIILLYDKPITTFDIYNSHIENLIEYDLYYIIG